MDAPVAVTPVAVTKDRFAGSLIGQCLGDALGFVVEGYGPAACRGYVDDVLRTDRAGTVGRTPLPFGQYTDDSQLARELMQSYAARGVFDPEDYAARIAAIFSERRIVGRGRTTEEAARRLARAVPWTEAGTPAPAAGNGSAMRAGPIGLIFFDDPQGLAAAARDQGRITHADPRCAAGSAAVAGAVALALEDIAAPPAPAIERLLEWTRPLDATFAAELRNLERWLTLPPDEAGPEIARAGLQPGFSDRWEGISPFVTSSVLWSLYSFLRTPDDYWETICTAIAVGGDVDTTAAMAGAMSGARLGLGALPGDLTAKLIDQGAWGYDELVELATRCHAIKTGT